MAKVITLSYQEAMAQIEEFRAKNRSAEGIRLVEQLISQKSNEPVLWEALGIFLTAEKHYEAAIAAYRRAAALTSEQLKVSRSITNASPSIANIFSGNANVSSNSTHLSSSVANISRSVANIFRRNVDVKEESKNKEESQNPVELLSLTIFTNLGNLLLLNGYIEESLHYHKLAVEQNPNNSDTWMYYGFACIESGSRFRDEGIKAFTKAIQLNPNNLKASLLFGFQKLTLGDYKEGWKLFENRIPVKAAEYETKLTVPLWKGESLNGKTLLLLPEQGAGDCILMSRFIPLIKEKFEAKVVLIVRDKLYQLCSSLQGLDRVVSETAPVNTLPTVDCYLYLMSLPFYLNNTSYKSLPPMQTLTVSQETQQKIQSYIKPYENKFKIGIVWMGNPEFENNDVRSAPISYFLKLLVIPGIELFGFQKGAGEQDIEKLCLNTIVHDMAKFCSEYSDTAAGIAAMDLIITIDTSVAHLAATMGKPTWILLHHAPYWLWMADRKDSPWYPSVRLYHQKIAHQWDAVFNEVINDLEALLNPPET